MEEVWVDIKGFNGKYQISNLGNIRSFTKWKNGGLLKPGRVGKPGPYLHIRLVKTCREDIKQYYIHRLVAEHFIPNPKCLPEVNHLDGNTLNNCVDNLEWCTRLENARHAAKNGLLAKGQLSGKQNPKSKPVLQINLDGEIVREWESVNQVKRESHYSPSKIFSCCTNPKKNKTAYGFKWEYKNVKSETDD